MIKIYIDCIKFKDCSYIEDELSCFEIIEMKKEEFAEYIKEFCRIHCCLHTCYDTFINHVGRFVREYGHDWMGEEFKVFAPEHPVKEPGVKYKEYHFNEKGQLKHWPYGIFGASFIYNILIYDSSLDRSF